jgi:F-type H+-transporting ATPase subunit a
MTQAPDIGGMILHHTADSHVLDVLGLHVQLPTGWYLFGIDVSPTKHVVLLVLAAVLVFVSLWWGGRAIERRHRLGQAPRGFGGAMEAMVLFIRNDVAVANIGHGGEKYAPYIATLFFLILYSNLLGLLPSFGTPTGNLAVTAGLALTAFATIEVTGMVTLGPRGYLKTIVMVPPGMTGIGAVLMAAIMTPVELIGKIVKPFALTLRLFANMTAGHFVILALLGLIFVFGTAPDYIRWPVALAASAFTLFMYCLELLVAFLQAYIFALLTSVFIGLMRHAH